MLDLGKLCFLNVFVFLCLDLKEVPCAPTFPEVLGFDFFFISPLWFLFPSLS